MCKAGQSQFIPITVSPKGDCSTYRQSLLGEKPHVVAFAYIACYVGITYPTLCQSRLTQGQTTGSVQLVYKLPSEQPLNSLCMKVLSKHG